MQVVDTYICQDFFIGTGVIIAKTKQSRAKLFAYLVECIIFFSLSVKIIIIVSFFYMLPYLVNLQAYECLFTCIGIPMIMLRQSSVYDGNAYLWTDFIVMNYSPMSFCIFLWCWQCIKIAFYILRLRQNGRHFPNEFLKSTSMNGYIWISSKISLKLGRKVRTNNIPSFV